MQIKWDDKTYEFEPTRDVTVSRLRMIKSWFPDLGTYLRFVQGYAGGDPDGLACVLWLIKTIAGEPCPEPVNIPNFAAGEFWLAVNAAATVEVERLEAAAKAEREMDPTDVQPEAPSLPETLEPDDSTPTPTSFEAST